MSEMSEEGVSEIELSDEDKPIGSAPQKSPLKPVSMGQLPPWIDDSYPSDCYFQNASGQIFILCGDTDEYETSDDEISSKTTSEDEASEEGVNKESSNSIEVQKYTSSPSTEVSSKEISSQNSCEWLSLIHI